MTAVVYASSKCEEFSDVVEELDPDGIGLQAPHEEGKCCFFSIGICDNFDFIRSLMDGMCNFLQKN